MIQITPAELTNSDGTVNRNSVGGGTAYWQYTLAGAGTETWMPEFYYHGCRFLQVALTAALRFIPIAVGGCAVRCGDSECFYKCGGIFLFL